MNIYTKDGWIFRGSVQRMSTGINLNVEKEIVIGLNFLFLSLFLYYFYLYFFIIYLLILFNGVNVFLKWRVSESYEHEIERQFLKGRLC